MGRMCDGLWMVGHQSNNRNPKSGRKTNVWVCNNNDYNDDDDDDDDDEKDSLINSFIDKQGKSFIFNFQVNKLNL